MNIENDLNRNLAGSQRRYKTRPSYSTIITLTSLGLELARFGSLEVIASFSSMTFLLVSLLVYVANLRLRHRTRARASIVVVAIILMSVTIVLLWTYLAANVASSRIRMRLIEIVEDPIRG